MQGLCHQECGVRDPHAPSLAKSEAFGGAVPAVVSSLARGTLQTSSCVRDRKMEKGIKRGVSTLTRTLSFSSHCRGGPVTHARRSRAHGEGDE